MVNKEIQQPTRHEFPRTKLLGW